MPRRSSAQLGAVLNLCDIIYVCIKVFRATAGHCRLLWVKEVAIGAGGGRRQDRGQMAYFEVPEHPVHEAAVPNGFKRYKHPICCVLGRFGAWAAYFLPNVFLREARKLSLGPADVRRATAIDLIINFAFATSSFEFSKFSLHS